MPKISVIIPVYNTEKYLPECLDSVVNQTLKDIEIICVNDGSTDNSLEILEKYAKKDKRIHIINKSNKGLGAARNTGIESASAPYLFFIDSDDWLEITCLEKLYDTITNALSDICIYGAKKYDEEINSYKEEIYYNLSCYKNRLHDICDYKEIKGAIFRRFEAFLKLYNRQFFINNDLFFKEGVFFEDVFTHVKTILTAQKICFCDERLYVYRANRSGSIMQTSNNKLKIFDVIKFMNDVYEFLLTRDLLDKIEEEFYNFVLGQILFHKNRIHSNELLRLYERECKKFAKEINLSKALKKYKKLRYFYNKHFCIIHKVMNTIFSLEKSKDKKHRIITIMGLKIKVKRKQKCPKLV